MSLLYSKLRLQIPQVSDGKNATITSPRGVNRTVPLTYPLTDVFVAGMDKYTVQAGVTTENFSVGNGKLKKIVTEDASALTVASPPTKTTYLVGENLDVSGAVINATIEKGDGTQETRDVASVATYTPPNGTQLNTQGTQRVNVGFGDVSAYFDVSVLLKQILKKLPYDFTNGSAVVYNGEIHILGGYPNTGTKHYKWNGTSWVSVSTLPYSFHHGCAVVYNNEIHILGGGFNGDTQNLYHYKWNGTSWASVSTLPYSFYNGCAVVYNNEIHILGSQKTNNLKSHYKWNGTSWVSVSTLPYNFRNGSAVVYNNEIHILGTYTDLTGDSVQKSHYKWNGTSWVSVSTLPTFFYNGASVVYNSEIHILGGSSSSTKHYKWNGTSWTSVSTLPYSFSNRIAVVWNSNFQDEIAILGSGTSDAQWDGTTWAVGSD